MLFSLNFMVLEAIKNFVLEKIPLLCCKFCLLASLDKSLSNIYFFSSSFFFLTRPLQFPALPPSVSMGQLGLFFFLSFFLFVFLSF